MKLKKIDMPSILTELLLLLFGKKLCDNYCWDQQEWYLKYKEDNEFSKKKLVNNGL